jgi:hypothetical protein
MSKVLVKDGNGVCADLPKNIKTAIYDMEFEKLDRFYRAAKVWFDAYKKTFVFEDRAALGHGG